MIIGPYADFRWGVIRGINLGFIWGFTLERHPLDQAFSQRSGR